MKMSFKVKRKSLTELARQTFLSKLHDCFVVL